MADSAKNLLSDSIILYPTDTLYGLGVDATDPEAIQALKELKGRSGEDEKKPISVVVADMAMARDYAVVTPLAEKLAAKFLPGALTLVLNARVTKLPYGNFVTRWFRCARRARPLARGVVGEDGSVGIRIPAHEGTLALVRAFGRPITATSANVAGMPTERTPEKILAQFGKKAAMITQVIDGGELREARASTVVDARGDTPLVLREGQISTVAITSVV